MDDLTFINELFERALLIAIKAHHGQVDPSGRAFILHPLRVTGRCQTEEERIVAILHDVVERTYVTPEYLLRQGFPQYIVDAILSITRHPHEGCDEFLARILSNPIGAQVKKHEMEDHLELLRLQQLTPEMLDTYNHYLTYYQKFP